MPQSPPLQTLNNSSVLPHTCLTAWLSPDCVRLARLHQRPASDSQPWMLLQPPSPLSGVRKSRRDFNLTPVEILTRSSPLFPLTIHFKVRPELNWMVEQSTFLRHHARKQI